MCQGLSRCAPYGFGITIFATDLSIDIVELALAAEARGFDSLWLPEHTHIPVSRRTPPPTGDAELPDEYRRCLDPFVALSAAAIATERLRIGTGIALVAQREPIVTAKAAATLDLVSRGRFTLGVGFGWNEDEMEDHGVDYATRARSGPRARARHAATVVAGRGRVPRPVRRLRSVVVVAEAHRAARSPSWSAAPPARSCSPTSPSTAPAGSLSAAPV